MANQLEDDTQGNVLGERVTFVYTANNGQVYNMVQDASVGVAVGNVLSTDADADIVSASERRGLKLRYINVEGQTEPEKKKRIVIGSPTNPLFTGAATTVSINSVTFRVQTIVGERRSTLRVQPPE